MRCVVIMINAKRHGFAKRWATISCMRQISLHVGWGCIPVRRRFAPVLCVAIQDAFTKSQASKNAEQCLTLMSLSAKPLLLYPKWHSFSRLGHNLFKKFRRLSQYRLPEWILVVDRPFSDEIVCEEIKRWVRLPRHKFEVRIIPLGTQRGHIPVK